MCLNQHVRTGVGQPCAGLFPFLVLSLVIAFTGLASLAKAGSNEVKSATAKVPSNGFDRTNGVGSWIWDSKLEDKQICRFWRAFEIPKSNVVVRAELNITADNSYSVFLDGREVGRGVDWRWLSSYDLTWVLSPGTHVLAVEAFNDGDKAGILAGLRVEFADEKTLEIGSGSEWLSVPSSERGWQQKTHAPDRWQKAVVVGAVGQQPWWKTPTKVMKVAPLLPITVYFWQTGWFQITLVSICGIVVLICLRLVAQVTLQSKAQRLLQLERARIARDIHDDLGARLTQLVLLGEVAQNESTVDPNARAQIDQICERARGILGAIDEIVWVVNSRRDTLRDFVTYVCKYAQLFLRSTEIRCRFDVEPDLPSTPFDLPIRRNLLLAVKEALNNAAKHSEATELFLRIHRQGQVLNLIVEDNGKGFEVGKADSERNGLTNMAQRMKELGGEYRISSRVGKGCRIEFKIPLEHKKLRSGWFRWPWKREDAKPLTVEVPGAGTINRQGQSVKS